MHIITTKQAKKTKNQSPQLGSVQQEKETEKYRP